MMSLVFGRRWEHLNRDNTSLSCTIEGVSGGDNIAELWRQHNSEPFNCVKSDPNIVGEIVNSDAGSITAKEVYQAITQLADNKHVAQIKSLQNTLN